MHADDDPSPLFVIPCTIVPVIFGPNITGSMALALSSATFVWVTSSTNGALYRNENQLSTVGIPNLGATSQHPHIVYMDASRSSSYYGASDVPQVPANQALIIIMA